MATPADKHAQDPDCSQTTQATSAEFFENRGVRRRNVTASTLAKYETLFKRLALFCSDHGLACLSDLLLLKLLLGIDKQQRR